MDKFTWGRVINRHEVGPYEIVEYHPHEIGSSARPRSVDTSKVHFHGYIDGNDTHESWVSLDDALVGMIVRRHAGPNCHAVVAHFMAGLKAMEGRHD